MKKEDTINIDKLLKELNKNLKKLFGDKLKRCFLFGSYAQQTQTKDSDIDVLVLINLPKDRIEKYLIKLDEITLDLSLKYDIVVSLLVKNTDEFYQYSDVLPLYSNIVKEGKEIYG